MKKSTNGISLSLVEGSRLKSIKSRPTFNNSHFCEVGSFWGQQRHQPRCKCSPNGKRCFHVEQWLAKTPYADDVKTLEIRYNELPESRVGQIDYVYDIIDLQIFKKFSSILVGSQEKQAIQRLLTKYANNNFKLKKKPYIEGCGWLAAHLLYHCTEPEAYFILQSLIEEMNLMEEQNVRRFEETTYYRLESELMEALAILRQYNINPMEIIRFFSNDIFAKSITVETMGWNIQKYFEDGWEHFIRMVCSYIDYKLETNQAETRNELYKSFFSTGNVEWPIVFSNMSLYKARRSEM